MGVSFALLNVVYSFDAVCRYSDVMFGNRIDFDIKYRNPSSTAH